MTTYAVTVRARNARRVVAAERASERTTLADVPDAPGRAQTRPGAPAKGARARCGNGRDVRDAGPRVLS